MKLTHFLDICQRKFSGADAKLLNCIAVAEARMKTWWQIPRDDEEKVTVITLKAWIAKHEPHYLPCFEFALKLHVHPKNNLASDADLVPHFINLIFARLCINLSKELLQPREMRRKLVAAVGVLNTAALYPLLLEFSGLEDADIPDESIDVNPPNEGLIICSEFVTDLESYFDKKKDGLGPQAHVLEQNLTLKASLNWFSDAQDDVDARRFAIFAAQSKTRTDSEWSATQQSQAEQSSSEDSDEPEPTKIKQFDLKSYLATNEMRDLLNMTKITSTPVKRIAATTATKVVAAESPPQPQSHATNPRGTEEALQMHKKVEWEQALHVYSEFCLRNNCGSLRFLLEHGMTTKCNGCSQQISSLGFQGLDVFFSVSPFVIADPALCLL